MTLKLIIMKTSLLLIALFIFSVGCLFGKIRNGYEAQLQRTKVSLQKLTSQLAEDNNLSFLERQKIKTEIKRLINIISCYELTLELIDQLRMVSPDVYNEIDSIKDRRGRLTDVFIKVITEEQTRIQLKGASFFAQASEDEDANLSEHGEYSVSVNIWIVHNALQLLYHELGHVKYVVPNLASYSKFYKKYYHNYVIGVNSIGHHTYDQSGKFACAFERRFFKDKVNYLRTGAIKLESAISIMEKIKRNNRNLETGVHPELLYTRGPYN